MSNAAFWLALLAQSQDMDQRVRLWNGYLDWKLPPRIKGECEPHSGWPQLTEEEKGILEALAEQHGGHPEYNYNYMDFSDRTFCEKVDLSRLILIHASFNRAKFKSQVELSRTRFYGESWFREAVFEEGLNGWDTWFEEGVIFAESYFKRSVFFICAEFMGGASFRNVVFEEQAGFFKSRFDETRSERGFPPFEPRYPADFRGAEFRSGASFREVLFGNDNTAKETLYERKADFSDAKFMATTDFHGAVFVDVPAFFNTTLHEDTDFSRVEWKKADNDNIRVDYAIRAWERLELMMSKLEKPLDRHRFFRYKMRARRRVQGRLLRGINWLFEMFADYGWGVSRACTWWFGHWMLAAAILFANAYPKISSVNLWEFVWASIGIGFANAHAFLFLTASGGYLEECRKLLESNDAWGLVKVVGVAEAILGPILLFLLLLTLQKRFRLA